MFTLAHDPERLELKLYCRASTTTAAAIDRYHTELSRLERSDVVDDVEVVTWPNRIELSAGAESRVAEAYDRFAGWADDANRRLAPAFDVESYESEFTGETGTALVTPIAALATYADGELVAVYPHVEDGDIVDVEDGIERLQSGTDAAPDGGSASVASSTHN
jgi:hypothetical protein